MVNCTPEFADQPKVINGFSDLMVEVFGDAGKGARSAVGMGSLPGGIAVEIEAIFQVTGLSRRMRRRPGLTTGRLEGRACLIVGGTGGIGLAAARRFLEEGARVVVVRAGAEATRRRRSIEPLGLGRPDRRPTRSQPIEVGRALRRGAARCSAAGSTSSSTSPGSAGGRFGDGPLHECTDEGWDAVLEANARGVFLTNRAAVRQMLAQPLDDAGPAGDGR